MHTDIEWHCPECRAKRGFVDYNNAERALDYLRLVINEHYRNEHPDQETLNKFEAKLTGYVV